MLECTGSVGKPPGGTRAQLGGTEMPLGYCREHWRVQQGLQVVLEYHCKGLQSFWKVLESTGRPQEASRLHWESSRAS